MPENSIADVVRSAAVHLAAASVPDPQVDAELLIGHVRGVGRGEVQAAIVRGSRMTDAELVAFEDLVARRAAREPLQHLTGIAPFRHLELAVGPGVFVPRPETEIVAQFAIDALQEDASPSPIGVDLCTGSGAIALALATEVPRARIHAVELSEDAHAWAARNTAGVENLSLVQGDFVDALHDIDGTAAVVVSNPPYVPDDAIPRDPEVRLHDPSMALYGGPDGLDVVRALSTRALRLLRPGGLLVIEHGELQGADVRAVLAADGWRAPATHQDLTRRDRATTALRP